MNELNTAAAAGGDTRVLHLSDETGLRLTLLDWGATWYSLQLPVPGEARARELLLGGPTPGAHRHNSAYFGATVGRYANRIAHGHIAWQDRQWLLTRALGERHQLHGGPDGWSQRRWTLLAASEREARYALHSPDGDQGFPGAVDAECTVWLPGGGVIELALRATLDAASPTPTPVNMTNHAYFNLDGNARDVRSHLLQVAASRYTPVTPELIPTGALEDVARGGLDLRRPQRLGDVYPAGGLPGVLDHAWLLDAPGLARPAATLVSADRRVQLQLATTLPALQVYSGEFLPRETGRDGHAVPIHAGVALEPQFLPDSPHHPEWPQPSCWLAPGATWEHRLRYSFSVHDKA